ncbi:MAG: DUF3300 domain-containing protein [Bryobacteraceae bacterium]
MKTGERIKIRMARTLPVAALLTAGLVAVPAMAQTPLTPPAQLDQLVTRIALYPDPLLAQVLTASTFWDVVGEAANWANEHSMLHGDQLAAAIDEDHLPWDPSVQAVLPFPQVLNGTLTISSSTTIRGCAPGLPAVATCIRTRRPARTSPLRASNATTSAAKSATNGNVVEHALAVFPERS